MVSGKLHRTSLKPRTIPVPSTPLSVTESRRFRVKPVLNLYPALTPPPAPLYSQLVLWVNNLFPKNRQQAQAPSRLDFTSCL